MHLAATPILKYVGPFLNSRHAWTGLTEAEALKTWTPLLAVLGATGLLATLAAATLLPLR